MLKLVHILSCRHGTTGPDIVHDSKFATYEVETNAVEIRWVPFVIFGRDEGHRSHAKADNTIANNI